MFHSLWCSQVLVDVRFLLQTLLCKATSYERVPSIGCVTGVWRLHAEPMMCIACAVYCLHSSRNAYDGKRLVVILSSRLDRDSRCCRRLRRHTLVRTENGLAASDVRERPALADIALLRCDCARRAVGLDLGQRSCEFGCSAARSMNRPCGTARRCDGTVPLLEP